MSKALSLDEISQHKSSDSAWVLIDNKVYDVTSFLDDHPGGKKVLLNHCGKDASEQFWKFHNKAILDKTAAPMLIGSIGNRAEEAEEPEEEDTTYFGDLIPFGDPTWYHDWHSPYYNDSHRKLRSAIRKFTDEHVTPYCAEWDEKGEIDPKFFKKAADFGLFAAVSGGGHWPDAELSEGVNIPGGVKADEWNAFHNLIVVDELSRCGSGGLVYGVIGGLGIGLPPVLRFASRELQKRIVPACLRGEKRICLAITEASGGSDVANLTTEAKLSEDGKYYIVNGDKKWITNGIYSDYFTTAVRTGGKGLGGLSLLVIERNTPGVKTRKMNCSGVWASGTTYITFEDVKVPVENLIGRENKGFQLIMANFNHERIGIAIQANRFARVCFEDALVYASKRKTFGTVLREHPVIRAKFAEMARRIEATHHWLEFVVHQSEVYDEDTLMLRGGGNAALLKAQATDTFEYCARESAQILGGLSYTRGGQGERIERLNRETRAYSIPGGSAEIMLDLSMRQAIKIAEITGAKL